MIGAGIIGVCTANYLLREGFDVEVIDPVLPGSEGQCSYGNAGGICPGSCIPNAMPGLMKNIPKWLLDPEGPLFVRLSYLPQALPWLGPGSPRHRRTGPAASTTSPSSTPTSEN